MGKREVMAIGGPWSPSLDGPNPSSDPSTLIKTAIRTCGALTGIDLSGCTQWTKFLQIHYRRQASSSKPARTETVVIFFPDVWSVMPNKLEYDSLVEQYSGACKAKQEGAGKKVAEEEVVEEVETIIEEEEVVEEEAAETGVAEPAKWNTLDPKNMKVGELRDQLAARGQLNKGLKSQLTARLQKCLKAEQEKDEETGTSGEMDEVKEKEGEKSKEDAESSEEVTVVLDERKKEKIASAYKTPSNPCIFVHPNVKAKSGKFDCRTETLSVLLDYRSEDNKEGGAEGRGGDAGGPNMRGGHSADRRNNDRQNRSPPRRARPDREQGNDREREKRNDGEREKDSTARSSRKRSRSPSRRSRSPARRSKSRSRSPPRRRARTTPRDNVSVPKISLNFPRSSVMELKKRYHNLYIPSDFFNAHHSWNEAFPTEAPFKVQYATSFNTFSKDLVEPPPGLGPSRWQFDPPDCDYTWVAKVMLLSSPNIDGLYEKTCNLVDSGSREREDLIHPTRALKFLVGLKEKREVMAIGGPWSPSLDGPNPSSDPSTLIKTAIRNCGALTGIDLSSCTKWTKFLKIHYRRQVTNTKPARTETVVIFFPDVWSVMPNKLEYDSLVEQYSGACKAKQEGAGKKVAEEEVVEEVETIIEEEEVVEEEAETGVAEPAKWNTLDPKNMKVGELRDQLAARGQLNKGLKSQLTARLQKCLKAEQEK